MMIQINHRESHDVDIFFQNPGFLQYLNPETRDFKFDIMPTGYHGDGSHFRKFAFKEIGEIDFIATPDLTETPTIQMEVEGRQVLLETVPEIITKKIYHRGASIKPRDIFDIAAAMRVCEEDVVGALRRYPEETNVALATMDKLNPDFVTEANSELMTKEEFRKILGTSFEDARRLLSSV